MLTRIDMKEHHYHTDLKWTGNTGTGTSNYRAYERAHEVSVTGKPVIPGSSDPSFRGDASRYNPEEMLVMSLSSCHMLWFLHLCSEAGVVVVDYTDKAAGVMEETAGGSGRFKTVALHPHVVVTEEQMTAKLNDLHHCAHEMCFIANSCNFPVSCEATSEINSLS
jgi:organic hydroperoxide reductase OsmC/OhrA